MDQPWVAALLVVALIALLVLRSIRRRQMIKAALEANPPGSGRRGLTVVVLLIALGATLLMRITDNLWWALLFLPATGLGFYLRHRRGADQETSAPAGPSAT